MKPIQLDEDVIPVSEFKANTAQWIERIRKTGRPVLLTQNGRSAAVVMNPAAYDAERYRQYVVDEINKGLADAEAGRFVPHEEVMAEVEQVLKKRRK